MIEPLTEALTTALLAVLTTAVPLALMLFRSWANAKIVAMEAATLAQKATLLAEATKRAAGQVFAEMESAATTVPDRVTAVRMDTTARVSRTVAANFDETLQKLGGSAATVAGMVQGELGKLLALASPAPAPEAKAAPSVPAPPLAPTPGSRLP
jgi:hypothetical protein